MRFRLIVAFSALMVLPRLASSQEQVTSNTYGIATLTYVTVPAWDFEPEESATSYSYAISPRQLYRTSGNQLIFLAPLHLPSGARIEEIQLQACDNSTVDRIFVALFYQDGSVENSVAGAGTGFTEAPGCTVVTTVLGTPLVVNNAQYAYGLRLELFPTGPTNLFRGVRVAYRLQVSPAPGTATFANDVPTTHPFFQFIEALAAAGITAGCAPGSYCPDAPVTRGQMAVFLARALGLHFPN
jgi:S-layer family protein